MRTKKVKPPKKKYEYVLEISKQYDEINKKYYFSFLFRTTKNFLTFRYILKVETVFKNNKFIFDILGFSAPVGELSNSGYAGYEYRMYDFKSIKYNAEVRRKNSLTSKFRILIDTRTKNIPVRIEGVSRNSFIEILTPYQNSQ
jgi:hypothetical protein